MDPVSTLLIEASTRLADLHDVDLGLDRVAESAQRSTALKEALETAQKQLEERVVALRAAEDDLQTLGARLDLLAERLPLSEAGWPERKVELKSALDAEPARGLALWFSDWCAAVTRGRHDAVHRLLEDIELPAVGGMLRDRCATAAEGLWTHNWHVAAPVLRAAADGLSFEGHAAPTSVQRPALQLSIAALATQHGRYSEAQQALLTAQKAGPSAAVSALWARWHRLQGDSEAAARSLRDALAEDPTDLGAAIELIERDRGSDPSATGAKRRIERALDAAGAAVGAFANLVEVDDAVRSLVLEPPAEVWLAVARRALSDGEEAREVAALTRAEQQAADESVRALVADAKAERTERRGGTAPERAEVLMAAGLHRMSAGDGAEALSRLERAHELAPLHDEVALALANSLVATAADGPLAPGRHNLDRALALIAGVRQRVGITAATSWCYLAEAYGHRKLGLEVGVSGEAHRWAALLACCRSIAHSPELGDRWMYLAEFATDLEMQRVAEAFAANAARLGAQDDEGVGNVRIRALANRMALREALEVLGDQQTPWHQAVRGFILLRMDGSLEAVRVLRATDLDPDWQWARHTLLLALILSDRYDEALAEARDEQARWSYRDDEIDVREHVAFCAMLTDGRETAQALLEPLAGRTDQILATTTLGMLRLLGGDADGAKTTLGQLITETRNQLVLEDLRNIYLPVLSVVAAHDETTLPSLAPFKEKLNERRAQLSVDISPHEELAAAAAEDVALPHAMCSALLDLAIGHESDAVERLEPAVSRWSSDQELERLLAHARLAAEETRLPAVIARKVVEQLRSGDAAGAEPGASTLLRWGRSRAAAMLRAAASDDPATLERLASALESPDVPFAASTRPRAPDDARPRSPLGLQLPASWFQGCTDPVTEHDLFLRFIPEMLIRAGWAVPPVEVNAGHEFDVTSRYAIRVEGTVADTGSVPTDVSYVRTDAAPILTPAVGDHLRDGDLPGLLRVPTAMLANDPLAQLLSMPAAEVVARRLGDEAEHHRAPLEAWSAAGEPFGSCHGAEVQLLVADGLVAIGEVIGAEERYQLAAEMALEVEAIPVGVAGLSRAGALLAARGDAGAALDTWKRALQALSNAGDSSPYWSLVQSCSALGSTVTRDPAVSMLLREIRDDPTWGGSMYEFRSNLHAALPLNWSVKESVTLVAPDGTANVIVSSEPLEESIETAAYAELQGDLLVRDFPGYEEHSRETANIFGGRDGITRCFSWGPQDGEPVMQIQMYYAHRGRGYTATATTPAEQFPGYELQLREILEALIVDSR